MHKQKATKAQQACTFLVAQTMWIQSYIQAMWIHPYIEKTMWIHQFTKKPTAQAMWIHPYIHCRGDNVELNILRYSMPGKCGYIPI